MLKEFIESISRMATEAVEPKVIPIPGDVRSQIMRLGETFTLATVPPPLRKHEVHTLFDLVEAVKAYKGSVASVWHDHSGIVAILDDADRLDRVDMCLCESEQLATLRKLPRKFDQRGLITFLKRDLAGATSDAIIATFRGISFRRSDAGTGAVSHGGESLGRSVESAVEGTGEIPERLLVEVPIYANLGLRVRRQISLDLEVDSREATFTLAVLPDEIVTAIQKMQDQIKAMLCELIGEDDSVRIFFGSP